MQSPWHDAPRRRAGWFALIAGVLLAHLLFAAKVAVNIIDWDAAGEPRRIDVSLVNELAPATPPVVAATLPPPQAPRARAPRAAPRPAHVASEALEATPATQPAAASGPPGEIPQPGHADVAPGVEDLADPGPPAEAAAAEARAAEQRAAAEASAASAASAAESGQLALDWPPSTRLDYTLTGLFRNGPLYGSGVVEWRRDGAHYQVEFDFNIIPFLDGHLFSDGRIGAAGLRPNHYDEWRKFPLRDRLVKKIEFGDDEILLNNGRRTQRLEQTQDPSSQFVQFVWMFTTHPEWLKPGTVVTIPLALPNSLRVWHYRVAATETLQLPFGAIEASHLVPIDPRKPNELAFELWIAPTLQYLPVRIHVPLDDQNFADLTLQGLPQQAAAAASAPARPARPVFQAPPPLRNLP